MKLSQDAEVPSFHLDNGTEMVVHLGMTGNCFRVMTCRSYLRAWWRLDNDLILGYRDVRRFGRIRIYSPGQYEGTLGSLGPEPLSDDFTADQFYASLKASNRKIKRNFSANVLLLGLAISMLMKRVSEQVFIRC